MMSFEQAQWLGIKYKIGLQFLVITANGTSAALVF
jgi:predicted aspartyl protease